MMTLLNVSSASPSSILKRAGDAPFVDLIELPHMNLSFKAKQNSDNDLFVLIYYPVALYLDD
eukprot:scaffold7464_cov267-Chaetoceros_neogracile.AAC.2